LPLGVRKRQDFVRRQIELMEVPSKRISLAGWKKSVDTVTGPVQSSRLLS
jgi:hypothetical protein